MKVLCIDSMDYRVVEKMGLKNLLSKHHGQLEVPINKRVKQPLSPDVWRAFLTGVHKPVDFTGDPQLLKALEFVRARVPLKLGLGKRFKAEKDYPEKDFIGFIEELGFKEVNFPYYSFDFPRLASYTSAWLDGGLTENDFLDWMFSEFRKEREEMFGLEGDVAAYFPQLDTIQHCFWKTPEIIDRWYNYFNTLAGEWQPDFIMSDHGAEKGVHSMKGFWSSALDVEVVSVTDFRLLFARLLRVDLVNRGEVKKRLRDLGYV